MQEAFMSARLHAYPAIQANYLAVEHLVLDDVFCQGRVLIWSAQARWERHLLTQREADRFRRTRQHRRIENTGGNSHHPNAIASKVTCYGQRHTDNTTFGGGVRRLANLTIKRGNRGSIDNNTPLATFVW